MSENEFHGSMTFLNFSKPTWKCTLAPQCVLHVVTPPNAVHRLMQRLVLGFKWERLP